jgi:hypothetical protein
VVVIPAADAERISTWAEAHRAVLIPDDVASARDPREVDLDLLRTDLLFHPGLHTVADFVAAARARMELRSLESQLRDLAAFGLQASAPAVRALARPGVSFDELTDVDDTTLPVGVSKLCGAPDLAPDEVWPSHPPGRPLDFVGQLDLAALPVAIPPPW